MISTNNTISTAAVKANLSVKTKEENSSMNSTEDKLPVFMGGSEPLS